MFVPAGGAPVKLRVRVNVSSDTIVLQFVRGPAGAAPVRLEGHIVGYGSGTNTPQFIQLPTGATAEPKYLLSVQPVPETELHPRCTGKVDLDSALKLVVRPVSPTAALLSWASHPHDGYERIRTERSSRWQYEWCPTSDTVVSDLSPDSVYEISVRANRHDNRHGDWSKPVYHSTNINSESEDKPEESDFMRLILFTFADKAPPKTFKLRNPLGRAWKRNMNGNIGELSPKPAAHGAEIMFLLFVSDTIQNLKDGDQLRLFKLKPKPTKPAATSTTTTTTTTTTTASTTTTGTTTSTTSTTTSPPRRSRPRDSLTTSPAPRHPSWEESELFQPLPKSNLDTQGKKRFTAPHVVYQTGKRVDEPSRPIAGLGSPTDPPSNITVVTVEGCPSFVILDWSKTNDTKEYEVISTAKGPDGEKVSVLTTNQTHTAVENLRPECSYEFKVKPKNDVGSGPESEPVEFSTESADPRVSENLSGKAAIWTEFPFAADSFSDCRGRQFVKRTWYRKFVGVQLCNSLRYKIYLGDSLHGKFFNIGDQSGFGEDHCQFVDSFLDGRTGRQLRPESLRERSGFYRAVRQEPVHFGSIGGRSHVNYVSWYECGAPIPGKW
uniref:Fibronectin type-III domain-containing protein n=1 Tax=Neogobius melanostomus TaxID=47308 RepID=A0A8C6SK87_9GOBI